MNPLSEAEAAAIWQVLVDHAGAPKEWRDDFLHLVPRGADKFWFPGTQGLSVTFLPDEWRITVAREHHNSSARPAVIETTNAALAELRKEHTK